MQNLTSTELKDSLFNLTPVEEVRGLYFKREDKYAPVGYGNVNGSKMRQLAWLLTNAKDAGYTEVVSGGVGGSPQHIFVSQVCNWLGLKCTIYTGVKNIEENKLLTGAVKLGANILSSGVGYATLLDKMAFDYAKANPNAYHLETNITLTEKRHAPQGIADFHTIGGYQVQNIPEAVEKLIIPAGSCNSVTSILYGLYLHGASNIKEVVMMGIGNYGSKNPTFVKDRMENMHPGCTALFDFTFAEKRNRFGEVAVSTIDLNGSGYCQYTDLMPYSLAGIKFHPRYEGKVMNYAHEYGLLDEWHDGKTLFWIIGSEPTKI